MKTIWTFPIRSIRSSHSRSLRHTRAFLNPIVVASQRIQASSAGPALSTESPEMAPKFELKTPKGTKDCESLHVRVLFVSSILRSV